MQLQPTTEYCAINNSNDTDYNKVESLSTEEINLKEINVGYYIVVLPSSKIPTHGFLIAHKGRALIKIYADLVTLYFVSTELSISFSTFCVR